MIPNGTVTYKISIIVYCSVRFFY